MHPPEQLPAKPAADSSTASSPPRGAVAWLVDQLLAAYQRVISPLLPPACRFSPTCSSYARQALRLHPWPRAFALATWRLARCQPWCRGGHDPVPAAPMVRWPRCRDQEPA